MLKPIQRDQTIAVISVQDPAIDFENSETIVRDGVRVLAYARERFSDPGSWRRSVKFLDGEKPTIFEIGILPSAERARIEDECHVGGADHMNRTLGWRCFLHGLRGIDGGFDTKDAERVTIDGVEYLAPSWLRQVFVGQLMLIAVEVGGTIWSWNQLGSGDRKN